MNDYTANPRSVPAYVPATMPTCVPTPRSVPSMPAATPTAMPTPRSVPGIPMPWATPPGIHPRAVPTPTGVKPGVVPGVMPRIPTPTPAPTHTDVNIHIRGATTVVVLRKKLIAHKHNHFIGTGDGDSRFGVVKTNDSVGILKLFVFRCTVGNWGLRRHIATVELVDISQRSAVCRNFHLGRVSMNNHDVSLRLWLFLLPVLHSCTLILSVSSGVGEYIVPHLSKAKERYGCQQKCK